MSCVSLRSKLELSLPSLITCPILYKYIIRSISSYHIRSCSCLLPYPYYHFLVTLLHPPPLLCWLLSLHHLLRLCMTPKRCCFSVHEHTLTTMVARSAKVPGAASLHRYFNVKGKATAQAAEHAVPPNPGGDPIESQTSLDAQRPPAAPPHKRRKTCQPRNASCKRSAAAQLALPLMIVAELTDIFVWPRAYTELAGHRYPQLFDKPIPDMLHTVLSTLSYTTGFSGVDSPTVALNMIGLDVGAHSKTQGVVHPQNLCAVERNTDCRAELSICPNGPRCIFGDFITFCGSELQETLRATRQFEFHRMRSLIMSAGQVSTTSYCYKCKKPCRFPYSVLHVSGTPCTDFSSFGKVESTNGPSIAAFLIWAAIILQVLPRILLLENVESFPVSLLESIFGSSYVAQSIVVCNTMFGIAARRVRRYSALCLRNVVYLSQSLSLCEPMFSRTRTTHTWRDFFCAGAGELRADIRWGLHRTGNHNIRLDSVDTFSEALYLKCLLESEHRRLFEFITEFNADRHVVAVGQEPSYSPVMSTEDCLHTLIANMHIQWSTVHKRMMTSREALQCQGFPCTTQTLQSTQPGVEPAKLAPVCSYNLSRVAASLPSRSRSSITHQCGNAMCVPVVGALLQFIMLFVKSVENDAFALALTTRSRRSSSGSSGGSVPAGSAAGIVCEQLCALPPPSSSALLQAWHSEFSGADSVSIAPAPSVVRSPSVPCIGRKGRKRKLEPMVEPSLDSLGAVPATCVSNLLGLFADEVCN